VCAVAVLNDADYELQQHAPELLRAGGTELVGVIATYNMVSRFLVALDIDLETG
jgi:hypothetical protein